MTLRKTTLAALGTLVLALAACESGTAPVTPTSTPAPGASASAGFEPGVFFRDDFDGTALDASRWNAFAQSGIILVRDGKAELLNTGKQVNFPYVVMKENQLPKEGPFYVEWSYEFFATGAIAFALDYLPPDKPGEEILTQPFLRTANVHGNMRFYLTLEKGVQTFDAPLGYKEGAPHRVRLECDGKDNFRLLFDQYEVGSFTSSRRPLKFWVGQYPVKDSAATLWPRVALDYVTAAVLTTPAVSEPLPTPTPKPTPKPTPEPAE